ncbi:MAG: RsmB/NOP family class I SAM-dependent RNA methyltransferase [Salinarimonas sp.]|nr:RsmB/NOP family class I SAM-dependent RNA methyltransferase [Salinarimonas sp.]
MTPAARLSAAMEILADLATRRRPASEALKDWGLSHRFAGSKDRAAIASLVHDTLRRRASAAWLMGDDAPRSMVLGMLALMRGQDVDAIAALCDGGRFAPAPLSDAERERLAKPGILADAPAAVAGDYPDWLDDALAEAFGADRAAEMQALATRAPVDIRANTLKIERAALQDMLVHLAPVETPHAPYGLRILPGPDGRGPALQSEPEFIKGLFEIQDEGSQLAALASAVAPGEQVVDLCAGGGGKTLAMAAMMDNRGQIFATDSDKRRLAPIHDRLARAGIRNVQVRTPRGTEDPLADLAGSADCVLVDAPCTGTGTWRRNPDAKWRLRPGSLSGRISEQEKVLDRAAALVKPGGRLVYVTCSILPAENDEAIAGLLARDPRFTPVPDAQWLGDAGMDALSEVTRATRFGRQLTPLRTGTDGFFIALLNRNA